MNDQQDERRASAARVGRLPLGGMNDEDEITDLRRITVHGNGAAPQQLVELWFVSLQIIVRAGRTDCVTLIGHC